MFGPLFSCIFPSIHFVPFISFAFEHLFLCYNLANYIIFFLLLLLLPLLFMFPLYVSSFSHPQYSRILTISNVVVVFFLPFYSFFSLSFPVFIFFFSSRAAVAIVLDFFCVQQNSPTVLLGVDNQLDLLQMKNRRQCNMQMAA